jgi:hypothetical protein
MPDLTKEDEFSLRCAADGNGIQVGGLTQARKLEKLGLVNDP